MKLFYTLLGLVVLLSAAQADSIATIQLENRPAEEVIPIIEPMLGDNDAITGQGFKLFLQSSPETLARVKSMIQALDTPARILQVSVFQGSTRDLDQLGISGSLQIESGDADVSIGSGTSDTTDAGGSVVYSTDGSSASVGGIRSQQRLQDSDLHQVRVAEGTEAYIETGEQIPYFFGSGWITPRGVVGGVEYREVITGFYVRPRVHGDNVTLEVSPFRNSRSNTSAVNIETQSANTTVTGPIGKWLLIGGATEQIERTDRSTGRRIATQSGTNTSIWIKADVVQQSDQ